MPVSSTPVITGLKAPTDTGASAKDGLTKHAAPILAGTVGAGATVMIQLADGTVVGEATVVGTAWTYALPAAEGTAVYKAVVGGEESAPFTVTIDRTATAPTAHDPGLVGAAQPVLTGAAEPGAIVQLFRGDTAATAVSVGIVTADATGAWSFQSQALADGVHEFWATAIDRANNKSAKVHVATVDLDATAPADVPTLVLASGSGGSAGPADGLTVAGKAPAAGAVEVLVEGVAVGTAQAVWDGEDFVWAFTVPAAALPAASDAQLDVSARLVSAHGQRGGAATIQVDWDVDGPSSTVAITGLDDAGNLLTNTLSPDLSGTADADVTRVALHGADGRLIGEAPVVAGTWTFTTSADWATAAGETIAVTGYDAAGNASGTAAFGLTGDVVAPAMPTVIGFDAPVALPGAEPSNVAGAVIAHLRGDAPGAAIVQAYDGDTLLAQAAVRLDGSWSLQLPTSIGGGALSIDLIAIDPVGNASDARTYAFTRDLDTPAAPTLALVGDGRADDAILATNDGSAIAFEGTAGPDVARVKLLVGATEVASVVPGPGGAFSVQTQYPLPEGSHAVSVVLIDQGGNETHLDRTVVVDTLAPAAPAFAALVESATPAPILTGTAEPNSWITLSDDGGPIATTQVNSSGAWSVAFPGPMPDGETAFSVAASDAAGNVGASRAGTLVVRTAGSPPLITSVQGDADPTAAALTPLTAPELRGTAEAGSQVVVAWGTESVTTSADAAGAWTVVLALAPGATTPVTVTGTDRFGHVAATSLAIQVGGTLAAPTGPLAIEADADGITNNPLPAFTGVEAPGRTVLLLVDGTLVDQATADATTGAWRIPTATALAEGPHEARIVLRDATGNLSDPSAPFAFTVDLHAEIRTPASFAPDTGFSAADAVTNAASLALAGEIEPGASVAIQLGAAAYATAADGAGGWAFDLPVPADGAQTVQLTYTDVAGNTAAESLAFRRDSSAAGIVVGTPAFASGADNGPSATDGIAYAASGLTFTGTTLDAAQVELWLNGAYLATTTTGFDRQDADGTLGAASWTYQLPALGAGAHSLHVVALDLAGNPSASSAALPFTVVEALAAPTLTFAPGFDPDEDGVTGTRLAGLAGRAAADTDALTIQIAGRPDLAVDLTDPANFVLDGDGTKLFELPVAVTLVEGANLITAIAHDTAYGRNAATSATFSLDRTPPSLPAVTALSPAKPGAPTATIDPTPTLTGTVSEAGATITIKRGSTVLGTGLSVAGPEGQPATWEVQLTAPLTGGANALTIQARDRVGLLGPSLTTSFTYDDAAGSRPTIAIQAGDNGASAGDALLSSATITVGGQLNGAPAVELVEHGAVLAGVTPTYDGTGGWSAAIPQAILTEGAHALTARVAGAGGDGGAATLIFTVDRSTDTTAPALAPALIGDGGAIATVARPGLSGVAEAGARVRVRLVRGADDVVLETTAVTADLHGAWRYTPTSDLGAGSYLATAQVEADAAGNASPIRETAFTVDLAVAAPVITGWSDDTTVPGYAAGASDGVTSDGTPTFVGTAEPFAKVELVVDGVVVATVADVGAGGTWSLAAPELEDGPRSVAARATDRLGNVSTGNAQVVTIDQLPPPTTAGAPVLRLADDSGPADGRSRVARPRFDGTVADADAAFVTIYASHASQPLTAWGVTSVVGGAWSFQPAADLGSEGDWQVTVRAQDVAGNLGATSAAYTYDYDLNAPALTITSLASASPLNAWIAVRDPAVTVRGGAEAHAIVSIFEGATLLVTTAALADGTYSVQLPALSQGAHVLAAEALDEGGQTTSRVSRAITVDTIGPAAPTIAYANDGPPSTSDGIGQARNLANGTVSGAATTGAGIEVALRLANTTTTIPIPATISSGTWRPTASVAINTAGDHTLAVTLIDADGNRTTATRPFIVDVSTTVPTMDFLPGRDADGLSVTSDTTPTFTGIAEPNATVQVQILTSTSGTVLSHSFVTAGNDGSWAVTPTIPLATDGAYSAAARVAGDRAGNFSAYTPGIPFLLDRVAAGTATIASIGPDTMGTGIGSTSDHVTAATSVVVAGTGPDGATFSLYLNGVFVTAQADAWGGAADFALDSGALAEGTYAVRVDATDRPGNTTTTLGPTLVIDRSGDLITSPSLAASADTGVSATDERTNADVLRLEGYTQAFARVELTPIWSGVEQPGLRATAVADATGFWTLDIGHASLTALDADVTFRAVVSDLAGNQRDQVLPLTVTLDNVPPAAGTATLALATASDTGRFADDGITRDPRPVFFGDHAGTDGYVAVVGARDGGAEVVLGVTAVTGSTWSYQLPTALADGTWAMTARSADAAGNVRAASAAPVSVVIDTAAPAYSLEVTGLTGTTISGGTVGFTSAPTYGLELSMPGETGAQVSVTRTHVLTTTVVTDFVAPNGELSFNLSASTGQGTYRHTGVITDVAGNVRSVDFGSVVYDNTRPSQPIVHAFPTAAANGLFTLSGQGEFSAIIEIKDNGTVIGTAQVGSSGSNNLADWSYTATAPLAAGSHTLAVTQIDRAGNVGFAMTGAAFNVSPGTAFQLASPLDGVYRTTHTSGTMTFAGLNRQGGADVELLDVGSGTVVGTSVGAGGGWSVSAPYDVPDGAAATTVALTLRASANASKAVSLLVDDAILTGGRTIPVATAVTADVTLAPALFAPEFRVAADPADVVYTLVNRPTIGNLRRGGQTLADGETFTAADLAGGTVTYHRDGPYFLGTTSFKVRVTDTATGQTSVDETVAIRGQGQYYELDDGPLAMAAAPEAISWCDLALDYDAFAAGPGSYANPGAQPIAPEALLDGGELAGHVDLDALVGPPVVRGDRIEEVYGPQPADVLADGEALRRMLEQQQLLASLGAI